MIKILNIQIMSKFNLKLIEGRLWAGYYLFAQGDGDWPDLSLLNPNQKNLDYLTSRQLFGYILLI